ncbi:uncharacterized protein LOC106666909 [Cimex lectularius]|uniref:RGS domain-containing protein n=1 Tax=Cimex lectularius TaxID=79782 RepID=A0A8I6TEM8_CIMLE|nr:uncharacterized protein LOC106666909 [Cimex lectularius]
MSCNCSPGPTRADINRWARNPKSVLECETGFDQFQEFLLSRQFDQELSTVEFYKKAADTRKILVQNNDLPRNTVIQNIEYLLTLADDVNFDGAQMRVLYRMRKSRSNREIIKILDEARQAASDLLTDVHEAFIDSLETKMTRSC